MMGFQLHVTGDKTVSHQVVDSIVPLVFYVVGAIVVEFVVMYSVVESSELTFFFILFFF